MFKSAGQELEAQRRPDAISPPETKPAFVFCTHAFGSARTNRHPQVAVGALGGNPKDIVGPSLFHDGGLCAPENSKTIWMGRSFECHSSLGDGEDECGGSVGPAQRLRSHAGHAPVGPGGDGSWLELVYQEDQFQKSQ